MEIWKDIPDCSGYLISNKGLVKSGEKLLKTSKTQYYRYVKLFGKNRYIHHLVYEVFVGPRDKDGYELDHINKNKEDNRLENIRYVPRSINRINRDMPLGISSQKYIHLEKGKYRVRIIRNGASIIDSRYDTLKEACQERDKFLTP